MLSTRPLGSIRPMKTAVLVRPMRPSKQMRLTRQILQTRPMGFIRSMRPIALIRPLRPARQMGSMRPTRPMQTNANKVNASESDTSNVDKANEAIANLADAEEANVNETNDGKYNFCHTTTSSSSELFSLFAFSQSPSQNIVQSLLK